MTLFEVRDLEVTYRRKRRNIRAVAGVSLSVEQGQIVGLVGESGCGKSTLARASVGLVPASAGSIRFDGREVKALGRNARDLELRGLQMVFQDPYASLNPRRKVRDQIFDALQLAARYDGDKAARAAELIDLVQMPSDILGRFPHELSGGQRQRVAIARALAASPKLIIADEALSALDASAQASVANLLVELTRELNLGLLFISHDLAVVRQVADVTGVMYLGEIVEFGPTRELWAKPAHPYTRALIDAVPIPDGLSVLPGDLPGEIPDPAKPPTGCRFHPRCPKAFTPCSTRQPQSIQIGTKRTASCWLLDEPEPNEDPSNVKEQERV